MPESGIEEKLMSSIYNPRRLPSAMARNPTSHPSSPRAHKEMGGNTAGWRRKGYRFDQRKARIDVLGNFIKRPKRSG